MGTGFDTTLISRFFGESGTSTIGLIQVKNPW